jgi:hypothetical protein
MFVKINIGVAFHKLGLSVLVFVYGGSLTSINFHVAYNYTKYNERKFQSIATTYILDYI